MDRRLFLLAALTAFAPSSFARGGRRGSRGGAVLPPAYPGSAPDDGATARPAYSPPPLSRSNSFAGAGILTLLQRIQRRLQILGYYTGRCDGADNLDYRAALDLYRVRNGIPLGRSLNQAELQALLGPDG